MEVVFEPWKRVAFRTYWRFNSAEAFAEDIASTAPPGAPSRARLFWGNGVVFEFANLPRSEAIGEQFIQGNLIWDNINFAPMPEYRREIRIPDKPLVQITVVDISTHVLFGPLSEWLRDNLLKETMPTERPIVPRLKRR